MSAPEDSDLAAPAAGLGRRRAAAADPPPPEVVRRRAALLAQASTLLAASLDFETTLERIARLAVTFLADLCIIDGLEPDGRIRRIAAVHANPAREALARELQQRFPPDPDSSHPVAVVLRTGRPEIVTEITGPVMDRIAPDPEHRALGEALAYTSCIVVPMVARGRILGAISLVAGESGRRYTEDDLALAEDLAQHAALAADNARLYTESEARRSAAEALVETAGALMGSLTVEDVASRVTEAVLRLVGGTTVVVYRLDPDSGLLASIAVAGDPGPRFGTRFTIPADVGIVGLAVRARRPMTTTDLTKDERVLLTDDVRARLETAAHRSALGVPLIVHDRVIGGLLVGDRAGRVFTNEEVLLARALASQAAVALESALLYEESDLRRREAEALADIGRMLTETLDARAVAWRIAESLRALLGCAGSIVFGRAGDEYVVEAMCGDFGPAIRPGVAVPADIGAIGLAVRERQPIVTPDLAADPRLHYPAPLRESLERSDTRSVIAAPLLVQSQVLGALAAADATGRRFRADEVSLVRRFADQAAICLNNARIYAAQETRAARLRVLAELNQLVSSSLDSDVVLAAIARAAGRLMDVPVVCIWTLDDDGRHLTLRAASDDAVRQDIPEGRVALDRSPLGQIVRERRPLHLADVLVDPAPAGADAPRSRAMASLYGVPIARGDAVLGVLALTADRPLAAGDEAELLEVFVAQAAAALGNARLYEEAQQRRREAEEGARQADEARREAEAATRAKDEFLAVLSHELRTPLTAMLGWTRMLRSGRLDEATTARALETIERNVRLQTQLVEDLLDVTRIVTGNLRLDYRPLSLVPVIEAAIRAVRPAADAKQVRVEFAFDAAAPEVWGDPGRLEQVIWNLLSNGVKFTPADGRVDVRLEGEPGAAIVTVRDTGRGIDPAVLPFVFDRFRQADSRITRAYGGLGLGLAIVRHLVELHGGTVQAESEGQGRGATFTVRLPALPGLETDARARVPAVAETRSVLGTEASLKRVRVLLVDDEPDARDLLSVVLESRGAEVTAVASAAEALEVLEWVRPDVIVSDIGMPGEDGYELMRKVRARDARRGGSVPAIALTAYARSEDRQAAFAAGFQRHIAKPVDPDHLVEAIVTLM